MSGGSEVEFATTTNAAYEVVKGAKKEPEYEVVAQDVLTFDS